MHYAGVPGPYSGVVKASPQFTRDVRGRFESAFALLTSYNKELANHLEVGVAFSAKLAVFVSVGKR
jgi:hypothetical protein